MKCFKIVPLSEKFTGVHQSTATFDLYTLLSSVRIFVYVIIIVSVSMFAHEVRVLVQSPSALSANFTCLDCIAKTLPKLSLLVRKSLKLIVLGEAFLGLPIILCSTVNTLD